MMCREFSLHCLVCLPCLSLFLHTVSPLCLFGWASGHSDPASMTSFFSWSSGGSPDSAPSSGAAHAGSVIDPDPPRFFSTPPRHLSVRRIVVFIRLFASSSFLFNKIFLHCLLLFFALLLNSPSFLTLFSLEPRRCGCCCCCGYCCCCRDCSCWCRDGCKQTQHDVQSVFTALPRLSALSFSPSLLTLFTFPPFLLLLFFSRVLRLRLLRSRFLFTLFRLLSSSSLIFSFPVLALFFGLLLPFFFSFLLWLLLFSPAALRRNPPIS